MKNPLNNTILIHPLDDSSYILPGTSPLFNSELRVFRSNITEGGKAYPAAVVQTKTVT